MANIKVNDLNPAGADLLVDSESFINELMREELGQGLGGVDLTLLPDPPDLKKRDRLL